VSAKAPPRWLVRFNTALLRRGLSIGAQHLLTVPGRKTGLPRATPISIAIVDGERYIVAAFTDAAWVANVRAAGAGTLTRGGRTEHVRITEMPEADREPVLRSFLQEVRGGRRYFGGLTADEVVAGAARYPVFRVS
jgi:deazaflavin-dependent oxidoreductase (nitroreductase family)